ncbi:hypothetical protein F5Y03DRAFT_394115 [Xylaria venustula]|nr:hypothetical protein F5Y03DRAFT_394115 [Xylaria venustula]
MGAQPLHVVPHNSNYSCSIGRKATDAAWQSQLLTDSFFSIEQYITTGGGTISTTTTLFYTAGNFVYAPGVVVRRGDNDPTWPVTSSTLSITNTRISDDPPSTGREGGGPTSISHGNGSVDTGLNTTSKSASEKQKRRTASKQSIQNQYYARDEYQVHKRQANMANMAKYNGMLPAELEEQRRRAELRAQWSPVELSDQ